MAQGIEHLPSPSLLLDQDRFENNIKAAEHLLSSFGKLMRPHVKTHRTPELARLQLGGRARGVTCATVGELEAMAAEGIDDMLLANEIVSPDKLERIASIAAASRVLVAVDSQRGAQLLSGAAVRAGSNIEVLIDVDVGLNRCGVRSAPEAVALARMVLEAAGLTLAGLMGYEGRLRAGVPDRAQKFDAGCESLEQVKAALEAEGIKVGIVSGAGTSTFNEGLRSPVLTEIQAGTYAMMEADLDGLDLPFKRACTVLATVISATSDRAVLDAGRKSIGCENGLPEALLPGASVLKINEEHTLLSCQRPVELGNRVMLFPSKVPTTFNLHDRVWLIRGDLVERAVPITARGRSD